MSLFETLKNAIFYNPLAKSGAGTSPATHSARPAQPAATSTRTPAAASTTAPAASARAPASAPTTAPPAAPAPAPAASQPVVVDVEAVLEALNVKGAQKLNWRTSIVDLMKLVDLDPSLQHRKELATELGYTGDMNDSAAMNIWLHAAVMKKLAANGGKVPASLQ